MTSTETITITSPATSSGTWVHQEHDFKASPDRVYEALMDQRQFAAFSGASAEIDRTPGGAFSLIRGRVTGRNVELVANKRIVQAWRVVPWAEGIYSIVRFELLPTHAGTRLVLDHSGFPPEDVDSRHGGWRRVYFDPLRAHLEAGAGPSATPTEGAGR
ncbi:MAG TPA: SRPBCC family protein [Xanthobacteraceae bacterium]|nr:SRPBCC family protein [Xanthobacteraceae bacterium]